MNTTAGAETAESEGGKKSLRYERQHGYETGGESVDAHVPEESLEVWQANDLY